MIRTVLVSSLLFLGSVSWAQSASIRALYQDSSFVPSTLLPFQVEGSVVEDGAKISRVVITSNSEGVDCRTMVDPYHADVFLLKCKGETKVRLRVTLAQGAAFYDYNYGPLEIKNPADGLVVVDPGEPENPDWLVGKVLFSRCIECHTPASLKGKKSQQIFAATFSSTNPGYLKMNPREDIRSLSDSQRKQIETYLANPTGGR